MLLDDISKVFGLFSSEIFFYFTLSLRHVLLKCMLLNSPRWYSDYIWNFRHVLRADKNFLFLM